MDKINEDGYRVTDTHVFFYKKWLSNFGKCKFRWRYPYLLPNALDLGEQEFFCTEQAFMWAKAKFFDDECSAQKILEVSDRSRDPMVCKRLGRKVKNYVDSEWDKVRYKYMLEPNVERFRQDDNLKAKILDPKFEGKTFVEASPLDGIWGIRLGMETPLNELDDESKWNGKNLLGQVITEARRIVKSESSAC